jgi:hypothetical protein
VQLITLADPTVRAMLARLQTDLPAAISLVNAQAHVVADGLTISDPVGVLPYVQSLDSQTEWPLVCIQRNPATFQDDTGWAATIQTSLTLLVFLQDSDQNALTSKLDRYLQALATCALQDRSLGGTDGAGWGLTLGKVDWGPTMAELPPGMTTPSAFLSWAGLTVNVRADQ